MDTLKDKAQTYWVKFSSQKGQPFCDEGQGLKTMLALQALLVMGVAASKDCKSFVKKFTKNLTKQEQQEFEALAQQQVSQQPCLSIFFFLVYLRMAKKKNNKKKKKSQK